MQHSFRTETSIELEDGIEPEQELSLMQYM